VYGSGTRNIATWHVVRKGACLALVDLLDAHPLRSRKAQDYKVWRRAVQLWVTTRPGGSAENELIWARMAVLASELRQGRRFVLAESDPMDASRGA